MTEYGKPTKVIARIQDLAYKRDEPELEQLLVLLYKLVCCFVSQKPLLFLRHQGVSAADS